MRTCGALIEVMKRAPDADRVSYPRVCSYIGVTKWTVRSVLPCSLAVGDHTAANIATELAELLGKRGSVNRDVL